MNESEDGVPANVENTKITPNTIDDREPGDPRKPGETWEEYVKRDLEEKTRAAEERKRLPISKRYEVRFDKQYAEARADTVRNIKIYENIQDVLGDELYKGYKNRVIPTPEQLARLPGGQEFLQKNPGVKIEVIKTRDGSTANWVISSQINDHLSSVSLLNSEALRQERFQDLPDHDYFRASAILLINEKGKVINLLDYVPVRSNDGVRDIRVSVDPRLEMISSAFSYSAKNMLTARPLFDLSSVHSFIHESAHLQALLVNRLASKYSPERDAAAFVAVAFRELKRREFLRDEDVGALLEFQQDSLKAYQSDAQDEKTAYHGDLAGIKFLAGEEGFTRDSVNFLRNIEIQKQKPPDQRKDMGERVRESFKELRTRYGEIGKILKGAEAKYDMDGPNFLQVDDVLYKIDGWEVDEFKLSALGDIESTTYCLMDKSFEFTTRTFKSGYSDWTDERTIKIDFDKQDPDKTASQMLELQNARLKFLAAIEKLQTRQGKSIAVNGIDGLRDILLAKPSSSEQVA